MTLKNNFDGLLFPLPTGSTGDDTYSQLLPDVVGVVGPMFCSIIAGDSLVQALVYDHHTS